MALDRAASMDKIRRSMIQEFVRMEDDYDKTRSAREEVVDKLLSAVRATKMVDEDGRLHEEAEVGAKLATVALKALSDTEKANASAISLKLRNQEQEMASAAAAKERIEIVLKATAPGRIVDEDHSDKIEAELAAMFDSDIKDFELKTNPTDLTE